MTRLKESARDRVRALRVEDPVGAQRPARHRAPVAASAAASTSRKCASSCAIRRFIAGLPATASIG